MDGDLKDAGFQSLGQCGDYTAHFRAANEKGATTLINHTVLIYPDKVRLEACRISGRPALLEKANFKDFPLQTSLADIEAWFRNSLA